MAGDESAGDPEARRPERSALLSPAAKSSLLWGVVGGLSFLVLAQGYELLGDLGVGMSVKAGVALLVAVAATGATHVTRDRLPPGGR